MHGASARAVSGLTPTMGASRDKRDLEDSRGLLARLQVIDEMKTAI